MTRSTIRTCRGGACGARATILTDSHFLAAAKVRELSFKQSEVRAEGRQVTRASGTWKYLASRAPGATNKGAVI